MGARFLDKTVFRQRLRARLRGGVNQ
jgi:hypothetical protein